MSSRTLRVRHVSAAIVASMLLGQSCGSESNALATAAAAGAAGPDVLLKMDFDDGGSAMSAPEGAEAVLVGGNEALIGRSLLVRRVADTPYLRAERPLAVKGAQDLRVAFMVRGTAMATVSVNVFDKLRNDNTTPASPARIVDAEWHPVLFRAEAFHYNSEQPDSKISLETDFRMVRFYGPQQNAESAFAIDQVAFYRGRDTVAPAAPTAVRAVVSGSVVDLDWQQSTDDVFAVTYSVYRRPDGGTWEKVGESHRTRFRDSPPAAGHYVYHLTASDYENNTSPASVEVAATTTEGGPAISRPAAVADRRNYAANVRSIHARGQAGNRPDVFLFAGDSITAASEYTHVLGSWLGRGLTVRQGVGMVTAEFGAAHIKEYLAEARPEFAVILYGTNDVGAGRPVADSMRDLTTIVDACVEAGTVPILTTIPPRGMDRGAQAGPERYNQALIALGREKQVPISYAFEEMMRHDLKEILYDGVHLVPTTGNDAAGRALRQTMDQAYFALRESAAQ